MTEARAETARVRISGFRNVFDREEFHNRHLECISGIGKKSLEEFLSDMKEGFTKEELHPSALYNEIAQRQMLERRGVYIPYGGAILFGTIGSVGGFAIGEKIAEAPVSGIVAIVAGVVAAVTGGYALKRKIARQSIAPEVLEKIREDLEKSYKVGIRRQLYPRQQEEEVLGCWMFSYARETDFNPSADVPLRFQETHSLGEKYSEPKLTLIVENGVPKRLRVGNREYYDIPSKKGERVPLNAAVALPFPVVNKYLERVGNYIAFV